MLLHATIHNFFVRKKEPILNFCILRNKSIKFIGNILLFLAKLSLFGNIYGRSQMYLAAKEPKHLKKEILRNRKCWNFPRVACIIILSVGSYQDEWLEQTYYRHFWIKKTKSQNWGKGRTLTDFWSRKFELYTLDCNIHLSLFSLISYIKSLMHVSLVHFFLSFSSFLRHSKFLFSEKQQANFFALLNIFFPAPFSVKSILLSAILS